MVCSYLITHEGAPQMAADEDNGTGPKVVIPTRITVSSGKRAQPYLFQAHKPTPYERVVALLRRVFP
jgi:hypothetical protein